MADTAVMTDEERVAEMKRLGYTEEQIANRDKPRRDEEAPARRTPEEEPEVEGIKGIMERIDAQLADQRAAFDALPEEEKERIREKRDREEEDARRAELDEATALRERRLETRMKQVPHRFRGFTIERPEIEQWAAEYLGADADPPGLLLVGPTGTRKTGNLWALYQHLVHQDPYLEIVVRQVPLLLHVLRPGSEVNAYDEIKSLLDAPLLMLDDLGAQKDSEWTAETLYTILDQRYAWMRPTIITSNLRPSEFGDRLGDRLASRIREMCRRIVFDGQDTRREP